MVFLLNLAKPGWYGKAWTSKPKACRCSMSQSISNESQFWDWLWYYFCRNEDELKVSIKISWLNAEFVLLSDTLLSKLRVKSATHFIFRLNWIHVHCTCARRMCFRPWEDWTSKRPSLQHGRITIGFEYKQLSFYKQLAVLQERWLEHTGIVLRAPCLWYTPFCF